MKKFQSLRDYILTLPTKQIEELYTHPAACLAVFRDLPDLAQHFVMRLLFIESPVPQAVVAAWVTKQAVQESEDSIKLLKNLRIWNESAIPGGLPGWLLFKVFRDGVRTSLMGGGDPWTVQPIAAKDKHAKDEAQLDTYATERWESVLHYMVGSKVSNDPKDEVGNHSMATLKAAGLIQEADGSSNPMITADGFQFLLLDTSTQVWFFMTQHLGTVEGRGWSLTECLSFLLQLSFTTFGRGYSSEKLSDNLSSFLQHLREFGLVYQRKRKDGKFYPTRLVINMFTGLRETKKDITKPGYIICETNYRIYAYTESTLQVALLALFTELQYRFPGFSLGLLTRESVRQALKSGIKADEIIKFLTVNSHPSVIQDKTRNPVPPTICDQIKYWEIERDRCVFTHGNLYSQFETQKDYETLRNYAKEAGYLVWESTNARRNLIISEEGHEDVKMFWKRIRKQNK